MEHIQYMPEGAKKEQDRLTLFKYILFCYNFLVFACACLLLGIAIWMAVDRNFMTFIVGNNLYAAAVFIVLAAGGLIFFVSFVGCCGAVFDNRCMIGCYFVTVCVVAIFLFIAFILSVVFHSQIGDSVKKTMSDTLINSYGVKFEQQSNRAITDAWDMAQERLMCCGVDNSGWYVYRNSTWFNTYGARDTRALTYEDQDLRPYVPQSCCVKDKLWRYVSLDVCQKWRLGPPGSPINGAINRAVYYTGCFDAGVIYLKGNAKILLGLAIAIALMLIIGIVVSALAFLSLSRQQTGAKKPAL